MKAEKQRFILLLITHQASVYLSEGCSKGTSVQISAVAQSVWALGVGLRWPFIQTGYAGDLNTHKETSGKEKFRDLSLFSTYVSRHLFTGAELLYILS